MREVFHYARAGRGWRVTETPPISCDNRDCDRQLPDHAVGAVGAFSSNGAHPQVR